MSIKIIGEIGINHNGDLSIAKKLIDASVDCGLDAVKFQKRTIDRVYSKDVLDSKRESPWGTTQREQKEGLEFSLDQYKEIDNYCKEKKIEWFASCWDTESQLDLRIFNCKYNKIASAMLSHMPLIDLIVEEKKHTFISTGMHSLDEIDIVVNKFVISNCPFELMHTVSTYPTNDNDANLRMIQTLRDRYNCEVGLSSHEVGRAVSVAAAALDISSLERHITLDRTMYGSDQAASMEVGGLKLLVNYVRIVESAMGDGNKIILDDEIKIREKLKPLDI